MFLDVTCSELRTAASNIAKANDAFRDSAAKLSAAAQELMANWEGTSRDKFENGMQDRSAWYAQISQIVDEYVKTMNEFAAKYEDMDQRGAALVRKG